MRVGDRRRWMAGGLPLRLAGAWGGVGAWGAQYLANVAPAGESGGDQGTEQVSDRRRAVAERTSLAVSLAIVLGLVGILGYQHFVSENRPAAIEVQPRLDLVRQAGGTYYLPVEVANRGDVTAQDVRLRLALAPEQGPPEFSELAIQFLAGGATARGTTAFRVDPARGRLTVDRLSFLEP